MKAHERHPTATTITPTDGVGDWADNPYASRMVEYTPYAVALGMQYVSSSAGRGEILLPWRADLVGQDGTDILAPGVLTALIDHACGLAIMAGFGFEAAPATLDLRIDHMRPAAPRASVTCCRACLPRRRAPSPSCAPKRGTSRPTIPSRRRRPPSRSTGGSAK